MTPTTPPAIPSDIPADLMAIADNIARDLPTAGARHFDEARATIARALLAAQERGKLMERERAIAACERQKADFLSTEYAFNQPLGSLLERFACDECIEAIRKEGK